MDVQRKKAADVSCDRASLSALSLEIFRSARPLRARGVLEMGSYVPKPPMISTAGLMVSTDPFISPMTATPRARRFRFEMSVADGPA